MAGSDIGYYTLPVILSFKGIDSQVEAQLGKSMQDLGKKTGEQFGPAVVATLDPTKSPKLNTAIKSTSGAGKKMGDAITTEVAKNIDGKKITDKMSASITNAVQGDVGKKMGQAVSTGITKNFDTKGLGTKISDDLAKAQSGEAFKGVGKKIGEHIQTGLKNAKINQSLKDAIDSPLGRELGTIAGQAIGKAIGDQVKNVPGFDKVAETVEQVSKYAPDAATALGGVRDAINATKSKDYQGALAGVDTALRSAEPIAKKFGLDISSWPQTVATTATDVQNIAGAVKALGSGDVASRIQALSGGLGAINTAASHFGVDVSGVTAPAQTALDTAGTVADLATSVKDLKTLVSPGARTAATFVEAGGLGSGIAEVVTSLGGLATAAGLAAAPLIAIGGIAAGAKWMYDLSQYDPNKFGPPNTSPALAPEANIPTVPGQEGLPPLVRAPKRTPRGDFEPAPPVPPPPPGREAATEIPQPGWTRDPKTGVLYTPDGTPVAPVPGEYSAHPPGYVPPDISPPSVPGVGAFAGRGGTSQVQQPMLQPATGTATISATSANISVGSATISGVSVPSAPYTSTRPGFTTDPFYAKKAGGGAIDNVPIMATVGEHMLTTADVAALGGQQGVYDFRRALHRNGGGAIDNQPVVGESGGVIPGAEMLTRSARQGNVKFNPQIKIDTSMVRTGPPSEAEQFWYKAKRWLSGGPWNVPPIGFAGFNGGGAIGGGWRLPPPPSNRRQRIPGVVESTWATKGWDLPAARSVRPIFPIPGLAEAIMRGGNFNPNIRIDTSMAGSGSHPLVDELRRMSGFNGGGAIGGPPPPPPTWGKGVPPPWLRRPGPNRAAIKGVYYGGAIGYDDGGEIKQLGEAIAGPVAKAAAEGAAKGAEAAGHGAGAGMALPAILGGAGGQQMGADIATQLLGIGAGGVGETLGLGTMFPDPMQNPNVRSLMALASAFKGPIMGAMKGKLGIQQPGWRPGMSVDAMAGDTGAGASIGLPFGLPSIDLPGAPEGGGAPPGGGPVGGGDTHVYAGLEVHGDVGSDKALRDHQTQIQRGLDRLAPMPTGPH